MRAREIVRSVVILLAALATARVGHAQTGNPAANISTVVRGGVVVVSYDLISNDPNATFAVVLEVSGDGGQSYAVRPRTLSGDVGPAVRAGGGKRITWEAARDVENLEVDRYRYRVRAEPVRGQSPTARTPQPPPAPAAGDPVAKVGRSKGRLWGGVALMGLGGVMIGTTMSSTSHNGYWSGSDKAKLGIGLGAIGGGVALAAFSGKTSSNVVGTQVVIRPGGMMLRHGMRF